MIADMDNNHKYFFLNDQLGLGYRNCFELTVDLMKLELGTCAFCPPPPHKGKSTHLTEPCEANFTFSFFII